VGKDVLLLHTSDLHVAPSGALAPMDHDLRLLRAIVATANRCAVDVVLLSGDTFDHNRIPLPFLQSAAEELAAAAMPIVILPGNHDPLMVGSVYERGGLHALPNVRVLGANGNRVDSVLMPELELEIWGRAHVDYVDMAPLGEVVKRTTRWQVVAAHGHVEVGPPDPPPYRPSWRISPEQIEATQADYVALGHWNRRACVTAGNVVAYYSGSPDYCSTVNIVRFGADGRVRITPEPTSHDPGC
jgi:DNA repair exonuclease SbcCD nuclease subunit